MYIKTGSFNCFALGGIRKYLAILTKYISHIPYHLQVQTLRCYDTQHNDTQCKGLVSGN
jgi:hypothetical protein